MKRLILMSVLALIVLNADSLETLNNRLAFLYKQKSITSNKLMNCQMDKSIKECKLLESKLYDIRDSIKKLEPLIREKELLQIIKNRK